MCDILWFTIFVFIITPVTLVHPLSLLSYSCVMPCQSPLVLGAENSSCTQPGKHAARHPTHEPPPCVGAHESTAHHHVYLCLTDSKSVQLHGSETSSETHNPCPKPQPKPDVLGSTVSTRLKERGDSGKSAEPAQRTERCCGECGHLLLAVVLAVFSPLIAVGICMIDLTGYCCNVHGNDSVYDS